MRWSISRRIFQIRSLARSVRLPDWHHTHDGVHLADFYVTHVVNEALDSWIVMYTGRDNKVNVEMESDYSYKIAVDIHEAIKKRTGCTFSTLAALWMILIRLKMMLIIHHITIGGIVCRSGTYLDFDMSQCRTDFKHTADNLSSSFRAFYASVNGYKFVSKPWSDNVNTEKSPLFTVWWKMVVIKESSIVNSLNRNGSNCVYTIPTCPHDQDGYARKICGRFSHYNCRWGNVGSQMISITDVETPDRILFRPVCQLSDYFPSSVRRIQRTVCRKGSDSRPRLGDILTCTDFFADPRSHQSKGSTDMFNLFILTPHIDISNSPLFSREAFECFKARSEFAVFAQCLASCSTESSSIIQVHDITNLFLKSPQGNAVPVPNNLRMPVYDLYRRWYDVRKIRYLLLKLSLSCIWWVLREWGQK
jgi:hypothetical protein